MVFRIIRDDATTFKTTHIFVFGKELFSSYFQKNGSNWSLDFFNKFGLTYWNPLREEDKPFTLFMRFKDEDYWDAIDNQFIKLPKIKYWSFGEYSKWGKAKCT